MFLKPTHKHQSIKKIGQFDWELLERFIILFYIVNFNIEIDSCLTKDFLVTLSILERGSVRERMDWVARLYDLDGDGFISGDELEDVIFSVGFWPLNPFNCLSANVTAQDPQTTPS